MSFKDSLRVGQIGETLYFEANKGKLERLDGRAADFRDCITGDLVELKMDSYSLDKTPNFFIEVFSDRDKQTTGGPYRALDNKCKFFVYLYVQNLTVFTFHTEKLIERMKELAPTLKPTLIRNSAWTTEGFLVPREALKDIYTVDTIEVSMKEKKK